jgi:3D (Asp-Asp-Asp) domain-containing protein
VRRGFYVLRETPMPSVLVEGGFLSNPREARTISSPAFHEEEAKALDAALLAYAKAHPRPAGAVGGTPRLAAAATVRRLCGLPTSGRTLDLVATAYGPTLQDNYPYGPVDAFGDPLKPGDVAVDPHLIPLGTHLWVSGYRSPYLPAGGFCAVARDTGGAIKGRRIDIFLDGTEAQVNSFGIQRVTAVILE